MEALQMAEFDENGNLIKKGTINQKVKPKQKKKSRSYLWRKA